MEPYFLVLENDPILARTLNRILSRFARVRCERDVLAVRTALDARSSWCALFFNALLPNGEGIDVLSHARASGYTCPAVTIAPMFEPRVAQRVFELRSYYVLDVIDPTSIETFARHAVAQMTLAYEGTLAHWCRTYHLSRRESEILGDALQGAVHKEIASSHDVSGNTLKKQVRSLLRKTGDMSLNGAAIRLLREVAMVGRG